MTDEIDNEELPGSWMRGVPAHQPTPETRASVQALASYGIPQKDNAMYHGITEKTLRKYYRFELDIGITTATAAIAGRLFENATQRADIKASNVACMFWLKCRAGWRDVSQPITDDPSALVPTEITVERTDARISQ